MNIVIYYKDDRIRYLDNVISILHFEEQHMIQVITFIAPGLPQPPAINIKYDEIARIHIKGEH